MVNPHTNRSTAAGRTHQRRQSPSVRSTTGSISPLSTRRSDSPPARLSLVPARGAPGFTSSLTGPSRRRFGAGGDPAGAPRPHGSPHLSVLAPDGPGSDCSGGSDRSLFGDDCARPYAEGPRGAMPCACRSAARSRGEEKERERDAGDSARRRRGVRTQRPVAKHEPRLPPLPPLQRLRLVPRLRRRHLLPRAQPVVAPVEHSQPHENTKAREGRGGTYATRCAPAFFERSCTGPAAWKGEGGIGRGGPTRTATRRAETAIVPSSGAPWSSAASSASVRGRSESASVHRRRGWAKAKQGSWAGTLGSGSRVGWARRNDGQTAHR